MLEDLVFANEPLVSGLTGRFNIGWDRAETKTYFSSPLALTGFGRDVLEGRADHAAVNHIDMWLGGTRVTNGDLWRWNSDTKSLTPPA